MVLVSSQTRALSTCILVSTSGPTHETLYLVLSLPEQRHAVLLRPLCHAWFITAPPSDPLLTSTPFSGVFLLPENLTIRQTGRKRREVTMASPGLPKDSRDLSTDLERVWAAITGYEAGLEMKGFRHGAVMTAPTACFSSMAVPAPCTPGWECQAGNAMLGMPFLPLLPASLALPLPAALNGHTVTPQFRMRKLRHRDYGASSGSQGVGNRLQPKPWTDDERVPLGNTSIFRRGTSGCFPVHS